MSDMPDMGNDRAAALRELQGQYGVNQNAEQLLQAHRARRDPTLAAASIKALDAEATDSVDLDKIDVPDGHEVQAVAVRGGMTIYVATDEYGNQYKGVEPYSKSAKKTVESPVDATARAYDSAATEIRQATAEQVAELEVKVAAFRAKEMEKLGKKLRADTEKTTEQTVSDAEKEAEQSAKEAESAKPAPSGPTRGSSGAKTRGSEKD